jgi:hypothetical protein
MFLIVILSGVRLSLLGTGATTGLLYQPQMIDDVILEQLVTGGTEAFGENLTLHHKSHMICSGFEPRPPRSGKPATNRLSYGTAYISMFKH